MPANRTEQVATRLRKRERRLLEAAARAKGVHLAEFVRDASTQAARRELEGLAADPGSTSEQRQEAAAR